MDTVQVDAGGQHRWTHCDCSDANLINSGDFYTERENSGNIFTGLPFSGACLAHCHQTVMTVPCSSCVLDVTAALYEMRRCAAVADV